MSPKDLLDAYQSIYLSEGRATDKEARSAAAARLEGLKKNPKSNAYVKDKKDPWMTIPSEARQIAQMDAYYDREAKKKKTNEELIVDYLLDEGYAVCEDTAAIMASHMSDEWMEFALSEMRKQDKVAGKKSGGVADPAFREVKKMMRSMQGTPKGQEKKVPGKKPPRAGEYGSERQSPKTIVTRNRQRRQEGERNMSSRFD